VLTVKVAVPPDTIGFALKAAVAPLGRPEIERFIVCGLPLLVVVVIV
jgi:hypothetical protein